MFGVFAALPSVVPGLRALRQFRGSVSISVRFFAFGVFVCGGQNNEFNNANTPDSVLVLMRRNCITLVTHLTTAVVAMIISTSIECLCA